MNDNIANDFTDYLRLANGDTTAASNLILAGVLAKQPAQQSAPPDAPLTVKDVACRLRISGRVAYELLQGGQMPSFRVGRAIRVKPEDLDAYIDSQSGAGRPDPLACHRRPRKPRRL
ncbi:MAG: helix-turn-helix domain-containing protein [Thermoguttaceae bacterium]|jgi:excisionase family DNA binding protein